MYWLFISVLLNPTKVLGNTSEPSGKPNRKRMNSCQSEIMDANKESKLLVLFTGGTIGMVSGKSNGNKNLYFSMWFIIMYI